MPPLAVRIFSAAVLLAVGFSAILLDFRTRWLAIALVLVTGAWELSRMVDRKYGAPRLAWLAALSAMGFCLPYYPNSTLSALWPWAVAIASLAAYALLGFRKLDIVAMAPWVLMNAFVCGYLGLWGARVFYLTRSELGWRGIGPLAYTILCVAAADTGAYAVGRMLGRRKLCPTISSGKSVEGAIGGTAITMLVSAGIATKLVGLTMGRALVLGAVLAAASIVGDLFISALKRHAGVKDTSRLIPGHGGVMDRFDALVFAAPIAWLGLKLLSSPLPPLHVP